MVQHLLAYMILVVSCRWVDLTFFMEIQQGKLHIYLHSVTHDSVHSAQYLQCIELYYKSHIPGVDITKVQKICIDRINSFPQPLSGVMGMLRIFLDFACTPEITSLAIGYCLWQHSFAHATCCLISNYAWMATKHQATRSLTLCLQAWKII